MTKEFLDDGQGHVTGVRTINVEWKKDDSGRWQMEQVPGTERVFPADLVFLAMGFLGPERAIADQLELKLDARSNFDAKEYRTNIPNVFAAGGRLTVFSLAGGCTMFLFRLQTGAVAGCVGDFGRETGGEEGGRVPWQGHGAARTWWDYSAESCGCSVSCLDYSSFNCALSIVRFSPPGGRRC